MRTLGNILWHIPFLGFVLAAGYYLVGIIMIITVILSPIGKTYLEYSKFLLAPYSRSMINEKELNIEHGASWNTYSLIIQILYLPFGLFSGFLTILYIVVLFFSIIGIPCAIILAKSLSTIINPVGKVCVPKGVAEEIDRRKSKDELDAALNSGTVEIDATKKNELLPSETIALNNNSVSRVSWVRLIKTVIVLALLAVGYLLYIFFN